MDSRVAVTNSLSGRLAPLTVRPKGTPWPSVNSERLVPFFARSVGFLPVFFSSQGGLGHTTVQGLPLPLNTLEFVIFFQSQPPQRAEEASANQGLKRAVQTAGGAKGF